MNSLFERVKELADKQKISIAELERKLGMGTNTLYRWRTQKPSIDKVESVADFFKVSTDYLLGRQKSDYWELNERDEKSIQKKLEEIIEDMANADALAFSKGAEPMSEETKQLLIMSLENSLRMGKEISKKKFTPKKYRGDNI